MIDAPARPSGPIVVGVDGSASSKLALRWAGYLSDVLGCPIRAVIAWHFPATYGWSSAPEDWNPEADAERCLADAVEEVFGPKRPLRLDLVARNGTAAKVLLEQSRDAAVLVVGSRGHGGFAGLLLGSVSTACAEHAACSVLVVHGRSAPPTPE